MLQQTQKYGLKTGLISAFGTEVGILCYAILSALGISVIFDNYPSVYFSIQFLGAVYLLYLAYLSWPRAVKHSIKEKSDSKHAFLKGLCINLTNPKIVIFFVSIITKFIPKGSNAITFFIYSLIFSIGGIIVTYSIALLSNQVSLFLKKVKWFDYVPPILFIAIAVTTITSRFILWFIH